MRYTTKAFISFHCTPITIVREQIDKFVWRLVVNNSRIACIAK